MDSVPIAALKWVRTLIITLLASNSNNYEIIHMSESASGRPDVIGLAEPEFTTPVYSFSRKLLGANKVVSSVHNVTHNMMEHMTTVTASTRTTTIGGARDYTRKSAVLATARSADSTRSSTSDSKPRQQRGKYTRKSTVLATARGTESTRSSTSEGKPRRPSRKPRGNGMPCAGGDPY